MRIFQLDSGHLNEIKEDFKNGKVVDYEKTLQNLIENNLSNIFPYVEFIKTEHRIEDLRPDTIAFDNERKSFVIIEYKNIKNQSLIDQGVSYYQLLNDRRENLVLLYNKVIGKSHDLNDFNWDETRVVFISSGFNKYQKRASDFQGLPIELYQIRRYQNNIFTLSPIGNQAREVSGMKSDKLKPRLALIEYVEEDYLDGKYHGQCPSSEIKKLWHELKTNILDVIENLEFKQKKIYAGFYHTENGSCICTMEVLKHKIILTYSTTKKGVLPDSEFIIDVTNKGHHGVGYFQSDIKNDSDIRNAIPLIKKIYKFKIK